jgi:hypothetical protein
MPTKNVGLDELKEEAARNDYTPGPDVAPARFLTAAFAWVKRLFTPQPKAKE